MKIKVKVLILAIIAILAIGAIVIPRLSNTSEFKVTDKPVVAFEEAKNSGTPILLEFYAKW